MMEKYGGRTNLEMDFFGGEPLMNWDVVKQLVEYARSVEMICWSGKFYFFTVLLTGSGLGSQIYSCPFCFLYASGV